MAVEGSLKCVKYLLFLFNFVFVVIGLALLVIGGISITHFREFQDVIPDGTGSYIAVFVILVGGSIFVIAGFGCFGSYSENSCFLIVYAFLLSAILLVEIAIVASSVTKIDQLEKAKTKADTKLANEFKNFIDKYNATAADTKVWDFIQHKFHCCGVRNYTDWSVSKFVKANVGQLPPSCCNGTADTTTVAVCSKQAPTLNKVGCIDSVLNLLMMSTKQLLMAAAIVASFQALVIICTCCLVHGIRSNDYKAP